MRAESRKTTQELEAAAASVRAIEAEAAALAHGGAGGGPVVPEEARRWLRAGGGAGAAGAAADDADMEEQGEEEDNDEVIAGPGAASGDAEALSARLQAGALLLETWRKKRQEIERSHGSCASLRALLSASGLGSGSGQGGGGDDASDDPLKRLEALQLKASTVSASIEKLTAGIEQMRQRVSEVSAGGGVSLASHCLPLATHPLWPQILCDIPSAVLLTCVCVVLIEPLTTRSCPHSTGQCHCRAQGASGDQGDL